MLLLNFFGGILRLHEDPSIYLSKNSYTVHNFNMIFFSLIMEFFFHQ